MTTIEKIKHMPARLWAWVKNLPPRFVARQKRKIAARGLFWEGLDWVLLVLFIIYWEPILKVLVLSLCLLLFMPFFWRFIGGMLGGSGGGVSQRQKEEAEYHQATWNQRNNNK